MFANAAGIERDILLKNKTLLTLNIASHVYSVKNLRHTKFRLTA